MEGNRDDAKRIPDTGYKLTGGGGRRVETPVTQTLVSPPAALIYRRPGG